MSAFVPGGQAGQESTRQTREAELNAQNRRRAHDDDGAKRASLLRRILRKLRPSAPK